MTDIVFRYFKSVHGRVVKRANTDTYIGCVRGPKGFVWDTDKVVPIPVTEVTRYLRDYEKAKRCGDLLEVDEPTKKSGRSVVKVDADTFDGSRDQDDTAPKPTPPKKSGSKGGRRRRST